MTLLIYTTKTASDIKVDFVTKQPQLSYYYMHDMSYKYT